MVRVAALVLAGLAATVRPAQAVSEFVFASNFEAAPDCSSIGLPGCPGFAIETPSLQIGAGEMTDACFAFRAPNHVAAIGRFASVASALVAHFIVWQTTDMSGLPADGLAPGTFDTTCGLAQGVNGRSVGWVYAAHEAVEQLRMPDDDGAGKPLAFELPASAAGFLEIIYVNPGGDTVTVPPVRFVANERAAGPYTSTASYLGLRVTISIPPAASGLNVIGGCSVPTAPKYWWFSTQTHSHATATALDRVGAVTSAILTSSDWEKPAIAAFPASPFYAFSSGDALRFTCTYNNNSGTTITYGDDYWSDEACMAIAYLFPSNQSQLCLSF